MHTTFDFLTYSFKISVMNLHLLQHGYPLTIIRSEHNKRVDYYNALAESDKSRTPDPFRRFVESCVLDTLERYLAVMDAV